MIFIFLSGLALSSRFSGRPGNSFHLPSDDIVVDNTTSLFLFGRAESIVAALREEFNTDGCTDALAVIAGFGDVGAGAYQELTASGVSCIVVDSKQQDVEQVIGNAEDEDVLKKARIEEARFCIVALNDDDVNIFTTLMARNLNPVIRILARANEPASVEKLYRAGADYVALLPMIGGQTIARIILADTVTILLELPNNDLVILKHVRYYLPEDRAMVHQKNRSPDHRYRRLTAALLLPPVRMRYSPKGMLSLLLEIPNN